MKEKKMFIAYTPALDLAASGKTQMEAEKNFSESLDLFFEELIDHNTLDKYLKQMGWSNEEKKWQPPVEIRKITSVALKVPVAA